MDLGLNEREVQVEVEAGFQTKMRKNKMIFFQLNKKKFEAATWMKNWFARLRQKWFPKLFKRKISFLCLWDFVETMKSEAGMINEKN